MALNAAHSKTLEIAILELAEHLLDEEQSKAFEANLLHTLIEKTSPLLVSFDAERGSVAGSRELFELQSYVNARLKNLS